MTTQEELNQLAREERDYGDYELYDKCEDCGATGEKVVEYDEEMKDFVKRCERCGGGETEPDEDEIAEFKSQNPLWQI